MTFSDDELRELAVEGTLVGALARELLKARAGIIGQAESARYWKEEFMRLDNLVRWICAVVWLYPGAHHWPFVPLKQLLTAGGYPEPRFVATLGQNGTGPEAIGADQHKHTSSNA